MSTLLTNCRLISPDQDLAGSSILIENGVIKRIYAAGDALPAADEVVDVKGAMTMPGFIDVHCHGKSGMDFCDATDEAMERIGIRLLFRGVELKPGMACAYGLYGEKLICGLSGNPASALTNFYVIALPALRKLMGHSEPLPRQIRVRLFCRFLH